LLPDRGKVRVNITMFGRETPVELDYEQIDKSV
jgi:transcriptional antiterminator NusG